MPSTTLPLALVILAHPDPASLNHALAAAAVAELAALGFDARLHDLYAEGFDPLLPAAEIPSDGAVDPVVSAHCAELAAAEVIVLVHPNWWGQPPAVLKGWVDRVVRPGVAYAFDEGDGGEGVPRGLLRARAAVVLNTSNTPGPREDTAFGDPLERLWRDCIFGLCGVRGFARRMYRVVVASTRTQREAWIADARALVRGAALRGQGRL
jgi:NAD(P)H dehydrogenase (quinone)